MFFFSVFTKVSRIVCFIPKNFCLSRFRICDNLFSFNEIFTGQTLNQDWGLQWLTGVTLLIFILMLETYKTVKEVNYVIIKMLMKYFSKECINYLFRLPQSHLTGKFSVSQMDRGGRSELELLISPIL